MWDIRVSRDDPCLEIPFPGLTEKIRILNLEMILVTSNPTSKIDVHKMHVVDMRNGSFVQKIESPKDPGIQGPGNYGVKSIANAGDRIVVSYNSTYGSGMLAEFSLSRNEFIHTTLVRKDPRPQFSRIEVCDSMILAGAREQKPYAAAGCHDTYDYVHFIHGCSFKTLGKLELPRVYTPWDYKDKRFVFKTFENKLNIVDF